MHGLDFLEEDDSDTVFRDVIFLALAGFALVTSVTPGPNNLMLMASGANFGFRRSVPHMLGISIGHAFIIVLVGAGLIQIFDTWPLLHTAMKWLGMAYLVFLAWKIANASQIQTGKGSARPMTFLQAAAFQWVNPKGWFMALTAITVYAPTQSFWAIFSVAFTFAVVNLPSVSIWTALGQKLRVILTSRSRLTAFNWTMAALLIASMAAIV